MQRLRLAGLLVIVAVVLLLFAGCGGGGGSSILQLPTTLLKSIGATGGVIEVAAATGSAMKLTVPAGSLAANTDITVTALKVTDLPAAPVAANQIIQAITFGPAGTNFAAGTPASLTVPLPAAKAAGTKLPLLLWDAGNAVWTIVGDAIVDAGGATATVSIDHFSTYALVDAPGNLSDTKGFLLGPAQVYNGANPKPDVVYSGTIVTSTLTFNCPIMKVDSAYETLTQAPAGAYTANQVFRSDMQQNNFGIGDVFVGYSQDYKMDDLPPVNEPSTFFFKMRVVAYNSLPAGGMRLLFEFARIDNPPLNIAGHWKLNQVWSIDITKGAGSTYTADVTDWGVMQHMTGTLNGQVYSGTWTWAEGYNDGSNGPGGTFLMTFNQAGTAYTITFKQTGFPDQTYTGTR